MNESQSDYLVKIYDELSKISPGNLAIIYKIIQLFNETENNLIVKTGKRGSLRGLWGDDLIPDSLIQEAKTSIFSYELKSENL